MVEVYKADPIKKNKTAFITDKVPLFTYTLQNKIGLRLNLSNIPLI